MDTPSEPIVSSVPFVPFVMTEAEAATLLAILVTTEDGRVRAGMTGAELEALLARLGDEGDRYVVVERGLIESRVFIQARRADDAVYAVGHRAAGSDQHFGVLIAEPGQVAALMAAWARRDTSWLAAGWVAVAGA